MKTIKQVKDIADSLFDELQLARDCLLRSQGLMSRLDLEQENLEEAEKLKQMTDELYTIMHKIKG